jgi:hypothetical protein
MRRRPPKQKNVAYRKTKQPRRTPGSISYSESDLSQAARRHQVILKSGTPRSPDGEKIVGTSGEIQEGWQTFRMWLTEPYKDDSWPPSEIEGSYSAETEQRIERALAAGFQQHERPDHRHFFTWPSNDDAKTTLALELIGARRDPNAPNWVETLRQDDEEEVYIEPQPVRR